MTNSRLATYTLLGRSGLRVSPLALGTMTFGTDWGWGAPRDTAFALLDHYLEAGGNVVDTADLYTAGSSERLVGEYLAERGNRDRIVLATKFTFNTAAAPGDPNAGGNGRKNILRALEASLRRLRTDYIDLYWLHYWDGMTPAEEVMRTLDDLVASGKIRYIGFSDVPAWYLGRAQTLAELRGWERVIALQVQYSLIARHVELEHIPAALALGAGVMPWSPLGSGLLTGKYTRDGLQARGEGRLPSITESDNPEFRGLLSEQNWRVVDTMCEVSQEMGRAPAQVALAWVINRPGVTSTIIGATKLEQLHANLAALEVEIPPHLLKRLDEVSAPALVTPYPFWMTEYFRSQASGNTVVNPEPLQHRQGNGHGVPPMITWS
jgi:aryl-alcohol dehydrogenase-like predicted oxidoreductase